MSFKFVICDEYVLGNIYAVANNGDLLYFRDLDRTGTPRWAYRGVGQKIGRGWDGFQHVFSADYGLIYAIEQNGDLLYYRDLSRDGRERWHYGGVGQKIGREWNGFRHVFSGGGGIIYAIDEQNGDLLYYRDLSRFGEAIWAYGGVGQKIGRGWGDFRHVFYGGGGIGSSGNEGDGVIYAIKQNGDLLYFRDLARDGTDSWDYGGVGQKIGEGWNGFRHVFSGASGIIYAIDEQNGDLLYYLDLARNGTDDWVHDGVGQIIHTGW